MIKRSIVFTLVGLVVWSNVLLAKTNPAKAEGILVKRILGIDQIRPTSNQNVAWGWSKKHAGLFIINSEGTIINRDKPQLENMQIHDVFPTKAKCGAWVSCNINYKNRQYLYFFKTCTPDSKPVKTRLKNFSYDSNFFLRAFDEPAFKAWISWSGISWDQNFGILHGAQLTPKKNKPSISDLYKYRFTNSSRFIMSRERWNLFFPRSQWKNHIKIYESFTQRGNANIYTYIWKEKDISPERKSNNKKTLTIVSDKDNTTWLVAAEKIPTSDVSFFNTILYLRAFTLRDETKFTLIKELCCEADDPEINLYPANKELCWLSVRNIFVRGAIYGGGLINKVYPLSPGSYKKVNYMSDIIIDDGTGFTYKNLLGAGNCGNLWYNTEYDFMVLEHKNGLFETKQFKYYTKDTILGRRLLAQSEDGKSIWFELNVGVIHYSISKKRKISGPILPGHQNLKIYPNASMSSGWIESGGIFPKFEHGTFIYSYTDEIKNMRAAIHFANSKVDSSKNNAELTYNSSLKTSHIILKWPGIEYASTDEVLGRVVLSIEKNNKKKVEHQEKSVTLRDSNKVVFEKNPFDGAGVYTVKLYYTDNYGSDLTFTWDNITVINPWFQRSLFRTSLAAGIIILLSLMILWGSFPKLPETYRGWLFVTFISAAGPGGATILPKDFFNDYHLDPLLFNVLLGAFVVTLLVSGTLKPPLFRKLVRTQPFSFFAHNILLLPHVRKRFYKDYYDRIRHLLKKEKEHANNEDYFPLPAVIKSSSTSETLQIDEPATYIFNRLCTPTSSQRPVLLIEGVGGLGKSALTRKIISLFLQHFDNHASGPLPIYIPVAVKGKSISKLIEDELGDHAISTDYLNAQLQRGEFIIIIDNLHEEKIRVEDIHEYILRDYSNPSPLLGISRFHKRIHNTFENYPNSSYVHPQPLTKETLQGFLAHYRPGFQLPPAMENACRTTDGTYSPLLVRLALLNPDDNAENVSDIYKGALQALLRAADPEDHSNRIFTQVMEMCLNTYWTTGERTINFTEETRIIIQKLLHAGILVSADDEGNIKVLTPRWVRFFHDNMQSYLTARALAEYDNWDALMEAAGAPRFAEEFRKSDDNIGTELYTMCLETFGPSDRLLRHLTRVMESWASYEEVDEKISKSTILEAVPSHLRITLRRQIRGLCTSKTLGIAITLCKDDIKDISRLFGRLAPTIYPVVSQEPGTEL